MLKYEIEIYFNMVDLKALMFTQLIIMFWRNWHKFLDENGAG